MEYYRNQTAFIKNKSPRGRSELKDISHVSLKAKLFTLKFKDSRTAKYRAHSEQAAMEWVVKLQSQLTASRYQLVCEFALDNAMGNSIL